MRRASHPTAITMTLVSLLTLTFTLLPGQFAPVAHAGTAHATPHYITVVDRQASVWVRNFNPFLGGVAMEWSQGGIYEPLMIFSSSPSHKVYPWLATGYTWADGNKTLLIHVRKGVLWSDGQPFTADDVAFTLNYGKVNAGLDQIRLVAPGGNVASVNKVDDYTVAVHLKTVDITILPTIMRAFMVPQHIWSKVKDPLTWTDPNPVGTGPFTEIVKFTGQDYIQGRNPHYWQPGKPYADGLNVPLYTSNDSANLALVSGQTDWSNNFVPNAQAVFVAKDPVHNHYFYATNNPPNGLWFNNEVYPFSLAGFRKALSHAIDRATIDTVAEYGYQPPSDAAGLNNAWPGWSDPSLAALAKQEATYDPKLAASELAKLGFKLVNNQLFDPKGHLVKITLNVINGWSDWVQQLGIIQTAFANLGIDTSLHLMTGPNWFAQSQAGQLSAQLHWVQMPANFTPYYFYNSIMSHESYVPTGQDASLKGSNWARYWNAQADALLRQFKQSTDVQAQKEIVHKLEAIFLKEMPYIPITYGATWYLYSTRRFTGWPSQSNFYVRPDPSFYPDNVVVMTTVKPVQ